MRKANINVEAKCPKLHSNNPDDIELLKDFYKAIDTRLVGIEHDLDAAGCEELTIIITPGKENENEAGN